MTQTGRLAILAVSVVFCLASAGQQQQQQPRYGGQAQGPGTCEAACAHYLECTGAADPNAMPACVTKCQQLGLQPQQLAEFTRADCATALASVQQGQGQGQGQGQALPAGTGDVHLIQGAMCSSSYTEISSRTKKISFDGRGRAQYGSEIVISGKTTDGYGNTTSTYGGYGQSNSGDLANQGSYSVRGDQIVIQWGDGSVWNLRVHHRWQGQITEFYYGNDLWAASLCN